MFAGQTNFLDLNLNPKTKFRNYKYVIPPKMTLGKMYRRNRGHRIQPNQTSVFRNARFLKSFAAGGLFRCFVIFAAAGNPLPNIKVGTLEKQISRLTVRVNSVGNNQNLKPCSRHS